VTDGTRCLCPQCGAPDALLLFQQPRCQSPFCRYYDVAVGASCVAMAEAVRHWIWLRTQERMEGGPVP